ncbi:MAG: SAM-dependent methyltransferase [Bacteroidales bacterium]|nr:SAM-dependent methyltransferase [Bacteroidales bacterium]MBP5242020.1 SAM-dependent methyltransferase [Bacteroidales bacterium]MBP5758809.1 SAM-dependent methyltransferase [Bacteroidales bacterium]
MKNNASKEMETLFADLCKQIAGTDFGSISVPEQYIEKVRRNVDTLPYYSKIYSCCLSGLTDVANTVLVDYGGGCAFLSQFAKRLGVAKVIYVDINTESAQTAAELKRVLGIGPDVIIHGDSRDLKAWCIDNNVVPDCLVSVDVIEHIYDLDAFFADLLSVNPSMKMVFTTASNPYNALKVRRLRKAMLGDEIGKTENPNFYTLRRDYIRTQYPDFDENTLTRWASATRGLVFDDIKAVVDGEKPLPSVDGYNTCDPRTGSWTERVLPLSEYRRLLAKHQRILRVENGFYDTHRTQPQKIFRAALNVIIRLLPHFGRSIAPFIFLKTKY